MTLLRRVAIAAGLGLLAGCSPYPGGGAASPEFTLLQEVNDLLHAAAGAAGRPPARLADLDPYQAMYPHGYEAVKSGDVVVLWGAALKGEGEAGKGEVVLAYEKGVPTDGGYVLLSAGTVKKMTAAEFNAAPKADKK
jgi:hypothetical protein